MSDLLTHFAVFEDSRRLALADAAIDRRVAAALHGHRETARLGAITRGGRHIVGPVLEQARGWFASGPPTPRDAERLAFALGLITHFAADVVLKPLMSRLADADWNRSHHAMQKGGEGPAPIREISAYYDCHVFREVFLSGGAEPFNAFLLAGNRTGGGVALEQFVRALFQRALLSCHTFASQRDDRVGWVDRLLDAVQPLYLEMETYTRVFAEPDPDKARAFGVEGAFYDRDDPAIALARDLHRAEASGAAEGAGDRLSAVFGEGVNRSGYAQALALSVARLREASQYLLGRRDAPPSVEQ